MSQQKGQYGAAAVLFVLGIFWILFVLSAFNYQDHEWFWLLLTGRSFICLLSFYFSYRLFTTGGKAIFFWYFVIIMTFQSVVGVLEGRDVIGGYIYVGLIAPIVSLSFQGTWQQYLFRALPVQLLILYIPMFTKNPENFPTFAKFISYFAFIWVGTILSIVVGRINTIKYETLLKNIRMRDILRQERNQKQREIEIQSKELAEARVWRSVAQAARHMAHDIRTPFYQLKTSLDGLKLLDDRSARLDEIASIEKKVSSSIGLVESLLQDIMIFGAESSLQKKPCSIKSLFQDVMSDVADIHLNSNMRIRAVFQHESVAMGDYHRLYRVFFNIINNALEATPNKDAVLHIQSEQNQGEIWLSIKNTESFIPEDKLDCVFDAFYTSGKPKGTGLGLAIAKRIIEALDGSIVATSSQLEKWVNFQITISAGEGIDAHLFPEETQLHLFSQSRLNTPENDQTVRYKAIVFEDDPIFQRQWRRLFSENELIVFANWREYEQVADTIIFSNFDYVVLDEQLGEGPNGSEIYHLLQNEGCHLPIFFCTSSDITIEDLGHNFAGRFGKDIKQTKQKIDLALSEL
ncbi:MAG: hybrid sensor histidine kinase/response regulator [Pseudobacteriovorax sp.]|nr:hybrid sensor histidine kinase/response regulator [Pseudobacteriovorax sp.]